MKYFLSTLIFFGLKVVCHTASGQCSPIALADSSFETGTLAAGSFFQAGQWYPDDGCEISGLQAYAGDSSACSIGGGAFQLISVDSNTTYYVSCYVLNGMTDPWISFNINWVHHPIQMNTSSWGLASTSFHSGPDTTAIIGFYSSAACADLFRLTCDPVASVEGGREMSKPYAIRSLMSANFFLLDARMPYQMEVVELSGKILTQIDGQAGQLHFGQDLPPAMYLLRIRFQGRYWTEKMIKY